MTSLGLAWVFRVFVSWNLENDFETSSEGQVSKRRPISRCYQLERRGTAAFCAESQRVFLLAAKTGPCARCVSIFLDSAKRH